MSGIKTVEELERELHNAKASLSYHKNKGKKKKLRSTNAHKAQYSQTWNDNKRAMSVVIARLTTTTEEEFKQVRDQAESMSISEARELTKGHEEEVAAEVKAREEKRRKANEARRKEIPKSPNRIFIQSAKPKSSQRVRLTDIAPEDFAAPQKRWVGEQLTTGESSVEAIVHVKASTLRLAVAAVESKTGFDGLNKDQVVGHIIYRYLEDNS